MSTTELVDLALDPEIPGLYTRPDYYDVLRRLRNEAPVFEYRPSHFLVTRHADVRDVSRDPDRFCSRRGVLMNDPIRRGRDVLGSILHIDPPDHGPWRILISRRFTPRAVGRLEARVRELTRAVLDDAPPGESIDFVESIAAPLPVLVIAELLDIPDADRRQFRRWSDACIESTDTAEPDLDALSELYTFLEQHVRAHAAAPGDDIVSALATADVLGRRVTTAEAAGNCLALLVAGNETTRHLLSGAAHALAEHPDQRRQLVDDPSRIAVAVEECLRWVTPIQAFGRTATRDTDLAGVPIDAGGFVVLLYASANRDEAVFGATADRFDTSRPIDTPHVTFGFGEHLCLGAALARLEGRIVFEELLARFPEYEITGDPHWVRSTLVRGMDALPAVLR